MGLLAAVLAGTSPLCAKAEDTGNPLEIIELYEEAEDIEVVDVHTNTNRKKRGKAVKKAVIKSVKNKKTRKLQIKFYAENASKHYVEISTDKKFKKDSKTYSVKKNVITIKNLKKGKTYYVRVKGANSNRSGKWSKVSKIKIKK